MRRKLLCTVILLCLGVWLLSACGKDDSESSTDSSPESASGKDSESAGEKSSESGATESSQAESSSSAESSAQASDTGLWADYQLDFTKNLSNPNASDKANAVYNWLCSIKGKYIISGLQEKCADADNAEFTYIRNLCGELPGLRGLDFISGDYEGVVRRSKTWDKYGSLISICWHMGVPGEPDAGYNSSKKNYPGLKEALDNPESDAYKQLVSDIDKAAPYLKELKDAGVVVLWRPFHEFDGGWFWWGMSGGETFVKLWQLMYDRYTNVYGLDNLIWVLGYSHSKTGDQSWYPGDEYVDIIAADIYNPANYALKGYYTLYSRLANAFPDTKKPFTLHECGKIPEVSGLKEYGAEWLWYLVWHSDFLKNSDYNTDAEITASFTDDYVLTLSEMPDFNALLEKAGK